MSSIGKKFLLSILVALSFIPFVAFAQTTEDTLDSRCFSKSECQAARQKEGMAASSAADGFYNKTAETRTACKHRTDSSGEELGFCLAAGQTKMEVKWGSTDKFANAGDFLFYVYRYGIIFASLLAVLIIIAAGFQWTASGGNSSSIESAKHKITGAITGLILVLTSYTILSTINPSTVNLRLPQVWLIREMKEKVTYEYCLELPLQIADGKTTPPKVGGISDANLQSGNYTAAKTNLDAYTLLPPSSDPVLARYNAIFPEKKETANTPCGKKFIVGGAEGSTCTGTYCDGDNVCLEGKRCVPFRIPGGGIGGRVEFTGGKYLDDVQIHVVCENDAGAWEKKYIDHFKLKESSDYYQIKDVPQRGVNECGSEEKVKGYFLIVEVNDSDLLNTDDDMWFGGKSFCKIHSGKSCGIYGANSLDESLFSDSTMLVSMAKIGELFSQNDMKNGNGIRCDFNNTPESMPNLGNGFWGTASAFTLSKAAQYNGSSKAASDQAAGDLILTSDSADVNKNFCPYLTSKKDQFKAAMQQALKKN